MTDELQRIGERKLLAELAEMRKTKPRTAVFIAVLFALLTLGPTVGCAGMAIFALGSAANAVDEN